MKRTTSLRLLSGTLVLAVAITLTSCKETLVKPQESKPTSSAAPPTLVLNGGGANTGGGTDH